MPVGKRELFECTFCGGIAFFPLPEVFLFYYPGQRFGFHAKIAKRFGIAFGVPQFFDGGKKKDAAFAELTGPKPSSNFPLTTG